MSAVVPTLLRSPDAIFERLPHRHDTWRLNARLALAGALGAAAWGTAVGTYVGGAHMAVTLVKMPIFFMLTLTVCFALMHIVLVLNRISVGVGETLAIVLSALSTTTIVLGALSPVVALFCLCSPYPNLMSYWTLYLLCAACGGIAGILGLRGLLKGLRCIVPPTQSTLWVALSLFVVYQFVGAQVAWLLRPWIGSSFDFGGVYDLAHGLDGNFYVGIWRVATRWLMETGVVA